MYVCMPHFVFFNKQHNRLYIMEKIEEKKPGIIDYNMLIDLAIEQAPKGEAGRLFQLDGVDLSQVKEMRIEFQNIVSLEQLWPLRNINKLILSHNCIEKISKLDDLIELRELDLSFNHISCMEGLNNLINLQILILSGNEIEQIDAIEDLENLQILSIADNKIANWEHVMYLRKFINLRSLNINGNPCMQQENYIDYVIAFIPQLVYFSYRMITQENRSRALTKYRLSIAKIKENEINLERTMIEMQIIEKNMAIDLTAFVENLKGDNFLNLLFEKDQDISIELKNKLSDNFDMIVEHYKMNICKFSNEIYEFGKDEEAKRAIEINIFHNAIDNETNIIKSIARRLMNDIEERRDEISMRNQLKNIQQNAELILNDDFEMITKEIEEFNVFLSSKWRKLMHNEIILHGQIDDLIESFRHNMSGIIEETFVYIKDRFAHMRDAESNYYDSIINELTPDDNLNSNKLMQIHDYRLGLIHLRENTMIEKLTNWFVNFIQILKDNEDSRHRSRILEISHFLQFHKKELENSFQLLNVNIDKTLEAEVTAVLND